MPNRLSKVPVAVYVPAVSPVQGRAAYCTTKQVLVGYTSTAGRSLYGSSTQPVQTKMTYLPPNPVDSQNVSGSWVDLPNFNGYDGVSLGSGAATGSYTSTLKPRYESVQTCYPAVQAVPGSPARFDYSASTGWNSGARSRNPIPEYGSFKGTMPSTLSATQFGIADRSFNHTYSYMTHSIVARPNEWTVVERGISKAKGALPADATLEIRRLGGKVVYLANGNELYTSESRSFGEVYGAALLYTLGDAVDDPEIASLVQVSRFSGNAPQWRMMATDSSEGMSYVDAMVPMPRLAARLSRVYGSMRLDAKAPMPHLLMSDRQLMTFAGVAPMPTLRATLGRKERVPSQMIGIMPPPILSATLRPGSVVTFDGRVPPFPFIMSDRRNLAYLKADAPVRVRLNAGEPYMPRNEMDGMDAAIAADSAAIDMALLLLAMDSMDVASTEASIVLILELSALDSMGIAESVSLGQLVEMLAMEQVAVNGSAAAIRQQMIQYAVNAASGALTTYQGFEFQGYAQGRDATYGYRSDGLYRIGAATDNGELISTLLDFGAADFGNSSVKRMDMAYLGVRSDGECYVRVQADTGPERIYSVRGEGNVRRAQLAKGVSGRYWSVKLELVDASFAEVDAIELSIGTTQRRAFGIRN